jgi:acyl dehydratase/predicted ester cyclase
MDPGRLREFATRYTAAWCSQDAASVAAFYAERGSLKINDAAPSVGRKEITAAAQEFMTAFPDMIVTMDGLTADGSHAVFRWTLDGTNTGPGGTGRAVHISGYEEWTIGADGLITESKGHFDTADYQRQLEASQTDARPRALLAVGQKASRTMTVTSAHVKAFAEMTGDYNPLHFDAAFAARTRFGKLVAQGGLTTGILHALVAMDMPGPGTVFLSQNWKFTAPVYIGDTIDAEAEVLEVHASKPVSRLKMTVRRQSGEVVLDGEAWCYTFDGTASST